MGIDYVKFFEFTLVKLNAASRHLPLARFNRVK